MKDKMESGLKAFNENRYAEAMKILLPLAESGNAQAQCYVATMFHSGLGVSPDGVAAVSWYKRAAEQEIKDENISAVAYNNLSTIYVTGMPGVTPNNDLARQYRQKAVELGFEM